MRDPVLDARRLDAVRRLLAESDDTAVLDGVVRLAAELAGSHVALVSLVGDEQVVLAAAGAPTPSSVALVDSLCAEALARGGPLVLADVAADPALRAHPAVATGRARAYVGIPLVVAGIPVGTLCAYDPAPRAWTDGQVTSLTVLARSAVAHLELRAARAELALTESRLELALQAASIGSFDYDPSSGRLQVDARLRELLGYDEASYVPHVDSLIARMHPADVERVAGEFRRVVESGGAVDLDVEHRVVLPDGTTRWLSARGRLVAPDGRGTGARLLGAAFDTTTMRDGRDQLARVLETMNDAFFSVDRNWIFTYVNTRAEELLQRGRHELLGHQLWQAFPDTRDSDAARRYEAAMTTSSNQVFEEYHPPPLDAWYEVRAWPTPDGLSVYFHDISERRRIEQEREGALARATAAQSRLALLAELTRALVSTLDTDEAMARLVRVVVPRLADWASVTLVDGAGDLRHSVARHRDPARGQDMARIADLQVSATNERSNSRTVARTGEPRLLARTSPASLAASHNSPELTALLERVGVSTLMVVPLAGRVATLGVLVLAGGPGRELFSEDDLVTAVDVGRRAGLALDNAELYGRQRAVAEVLQRSLLTALPEPDHLQMAARYLPAGQEAQVGGDFFWGALQTDGATVLAIGDVMGHDIGAAAAMGQVQNLLRGITYDRGEGPARTLERLDAAMRGLHVDTMATAVLCRVEQTAGDRAEGVRRLCWSNAGHPPPLLLRADGTVAVLDGEPDLLLGFDPDVARHERGATLAPGDTLVLYTDGLVERRDLPLDTGLARLRALLATLADRPVEELCDEVLARMLPVLPDDDVALLAMRCHPEDRPRPPEAGPAHTG